MSQAGRTKRAEPVDQRGDLKEAPEFPPPSSPRRAEKPPPLRLPSLTFPTDRLPQLGVEIVQSLPGVGQGKNDPGERPRVNHNVDPALPSPIQPEKAMYNLWEKTKTQTELRWNKPGNAGQFSGMLYEIHIKKGDGDWQELGDNRQPLYRVYYTEGVAIFGRHRITQESSVQLVRIRIRPVGEQTDRGVTTKHVGPWSEEVLFSLEGSGQN